MPPGSAFSPQQIRAAYGINLLSQEGVGQTIAIIDAYDNPKFVSSSNTAAYATSDLHDFDAYYGLPDFGGSGPTFTKLDENGGTNYPATQSGGNWESEIALDVEWAHAIAPLANIVLIEASSSGDADLLVTSVNTARNLPGVSVVSMSFMTTDSAFDTMYDPDYTTPSGHTPITFLAATGDSGRRLVIRRPQRMWWPWEGLRSRSTAAAMAAKWAGVGAVAESAPTNRNRVTRRGW